MLAQIEGVQQVLLEDVEGAVVALVVREQAGPGLAQDRDLVVAQGSTLDRIDGLHGALAPQPGHEAAPWCHGLLGHLGVAARGEEDGAAQQGARPDGRGALDPGA